MDNIQDIFDILEALDIPINDDTDDIDYMVQDAEPLDTTNINQWYFEV